MLKYTLLQKKLVNHLMRKGKKETSKRVLRNSLILLFKNKKFFVKNVLFRAIYYLLPSVQVVVQKRGKAEFQVPYPIKRKRSLFLAISWLLQNVV